MFASTNDEIDALGWENGKIPNAKFNFFPSFFFMYVVKKKNLGIHATTKIQII